MFPKTLLSSSGIAVQKKCFFGHLVGNVCEIACDVWMVVKDGRMDFMLFRGFDFRWMDRQTFVLPELLLHLKIL